MKVSEAIGARVRQRREELGMSQRELGQRLREVLGRTWSGQAVSAAEKGRRGWAAEDLVAVSYILGSPVAWFFTVPEGRKWEILDLPGSEGGAYIHAAWMGGVPESRNRTQDEILSDIGRDLAELSRLRSSEPPEGGPVVSIPLSPSVESPKES